MHPYCSQFSITVEYLVFLLKMQHNHASSADLDADPNKSALGRASHIPLACTPASVAVVPFSNLPCRPTGGELSGGCHFGRRSQFCKKVFLWRRNGKFGINVATNSSNLEVFAKFSYRT